MRLCELATEVIRSKKTNITKRSISCVICTVESLLYGAFAHEDYGRFSNEKVISKVRLIYRNNIDASDDCFSTKEKNMIWATTE